MLALQKNEVVMSAEDLRKVHEEEGPRRGRRRRGYLNQLERGWRCMRMPFWGRRVTENRGSME